MDVDPLEPYALFAIRLFWTARESERAVLRLWVPPLRQCLLSLSRFLSLVFAASGQLVDPVVDLFGQGHYGAATLIIRASNRQAKRLPSLHGTNTAANMLRNLFPAVEDQRCFSA